MDETALNNNVPLDEDRIRSMFVNQTLFISGGTGFMGKVLLEKLLRYIYDTFTKYSEYCYFYYFITFLFYAGFGIFCFKIKLLAKGHRILL